MKEITKYELLRLAKEKNPDEALSKMSYGKIQRMKDTIDTIVYLENDYKSFSTLMKLHSYVLMAEDEKRQKELKKIHNLSTLEEIISYVNTIEKLEKVQLCA